MWWFKSMFFLFAVGLISSLKLDASGLSFDFDWLSVQVTRLEWATCFSLTCILFKMNKLESTLDKRS